VKRAELNAGAPAISGGNYEVPGSARGLEDADIAGYSQRASELADGLVHLNAASESPGKQS